MLELVSYICIPYARYILFFFYCQTNLPCSRLELALTCNYLYTPTLNKYLDNNNISKDYSLLNAHCTQVSTLVLHTSMTTVSVR